LTEIEKANIDLIKKRMKIVLSFFLLIILLTSTNEEITIVEKPLNYSEERIKLSLEYLKLRHNLIQTYPSIKPKFIVLHYTDGGTIKSNFEYFNKAKIEDNRTYNKKQSSLNVSAHYLIDRDGKIYHLIADTLFARHTIGLNYCSIGIENIGSEKNPLTKEQVISNANLIRHLKKKYAIDFVIGHSEYIQFITTPYWKETNSKYITYKSDPGNNFLIEVRKLIADLNVKSKP
jgi:N-acetyl-anhydromuramyl-L-alanine amidase AmpD